MAYLQSLCPIWDNNIAQSLAKYNIFRFQERTLSLDGPLACNSLGRILPPILILRRSMISNPIRLSRGCRLRSNKLIERFEKLSENSFIIAPYVKRPNGSSGIIVESNFSALNTLHALVKSHHFRRRELDCDNYWQTSNGQA